MQIQRLTPTAKLPTKATDGAGCFDFYVDRIEEVDDHRIILYFGVAAAVPEGFVMTFQPRSSFTHKGWVMANSPGQIDSDYRGELQVRMETFLQLTEVKYEHERNWWDKHIFRLPASTEVTHLHYPDVPYQIGDRCIQARLERVEPVTFEEVQELSKTERASGGFGSSGK